MANPYPPLHYLSQLFPQPAFGLGGQEPEPPVAIPQRAAAGFYGLPSLEDLLRPDVLAGIEAGQRPRTFEKATRSFDNFMPGYRESGNVEDRRGSFEDMFFANDLADMARYWRSGAAAPLMRPR